MLLHQNLEKNILTFTNRVKYKPVDVILGTEFNFH